MLCSADSLIAELFVKASVTKVPNVNVTARLNLQCQLFSRFTIRCVILTVLFVRLLLKVYFSDPPEGASDAK